MESSDQFEVLLQLPCDRCMLESWGLGSDGSSDNGPILDMI